MSMRDRYTKDICNAFTGLVYPKLLEWAMAGIHSGLNQLNTKNIQCFMPDGAAAIGNLALLQNLVPTVADHISAPSFWFPGLLSATVANNQLNIVMYILKQLSQGGILDLQNAHTEVGAALQIAVHKHRTEAGNMILDSLFSAQRINFSMMETREAIYDCILLGSFDLLDRIL